MKASIKHLYEWSKDRELVTPEFHKSNDFYGHAAILKKYAEIPDNYQLKAVIEHGPHLPGWAWEVDIKSPLPAMLVSGASRYPILKEKCNKALFPIGPLIRYAFHFLDKQTLYAEKKRMGKTLLVFPPHSTHWVNAHYDIHEFCRRIESIAKEFNTVMVCVFWKDVLRGTPEKYIEHGFECVTAGHMYDTLFLPRLKSIIELATVAVSGTGGTQCAFCMALEKPIFIIETETEHKALNSEILKRDKVSPDRKESIQKKDEMRDAFTDIRQDISEKQIKIAERYWGFSEFKTPGEMNLIFQISEDMCQKGQNYFVSSSDIMTAQACDYLNSNDNEKALCLLEQAVAVNPAMSGIHYGKAVALARLGREDDATETLVQFLKTNPNHEKGNLLLRALKRSKNKPKIIDKPEQLNKKCDSAGFDHAKKIVHLCMQDFGGAGNAAYRLHKGLQTIGLNSTMLVLNKRSGDPSVKALPPVYSMGIENCLDVTAYNSPVWGKQTVRWQKLMREYPNRPGGVEIFTDTVSDVKLDRVREVQKADIINLHWVAGVVDWPGALSTIGEKPIVWTLHDMNPFTGGCHYAGDCKKYMEGCGACPQLGSNDQDDLSHKVWEQKKRAYQDMNISVVTPSRWLGDCASRSKLFSRFPVQVIPYGFPLDTFRPHPKAEINKALKIPDSTKIIMFGAHSVFNERKGFGYLLAGLNKIPLTNGYDIAILTFGSLPKGIKIPSKYSIVNLGSIADERQLAMAYSAADVFVLPSLEDNLPNTVIEAMACGVPVVGFDIGGMPDMIEHKKTGYLVKPKDLNGLMEGIDWVLSSSERSTKLSEHCREKVKEEYALEVQANSYCKLYSGIFKDHFPLIENPYSKAKKLNQHGEDLLSNGDIEGALDFFTKAVHIVPDDAVTHNKLAALYRNRGMQEKALEHAKKAAELQPDNLTFQKNLADFFWGGLEHIEEALKIYNKILNENPEDIETLLIVGHIGIKLGKVDSALEFYNRVLEIDSGNTNALEALRQIRKKVAQYFLNVSRNHLSEHFASEYGKIHRKIMTSHLKDYPLSDDEQVFLEALTCKMDRIANSSEAISSLLVSSMLYYSPHQMPIEFDLLQVSDWLQEDYCAFLLTYPRCFVGKGEVDDYCRYIKRIFASFHKSLLQQPDSISVQKLAQIFTQNTCFIPLYFSRENLKDIYCHRAAIAELNLKARGYELDFAFPPRTAKRKKIRLGIYARVIAPGTEAFATLPVYEHLKRQEFEVFLYVHQCNGNPVENHARQAADRFIVLPETMQSSVDIIRADDLDVMFFSNNLSAVMNQAFILANHRLARFQGVHFCQPVTTGLKHIEYFFLGNLIQENGKANQQFHEQTVNLAGSGICFDMRRTNDPRGAVIGRDQIGIPGNRVVFVSGANFFKIIPELRHLWAKLLAKVPDAMLVLFPFGPAWSRSYPQSVFRDLFASTLADHDVNEDRLIVLDPLPHREDIKELLRITDVYLDAVPYSGATSLLDPLEVGVPPVVMEGDELRSRQGSAILKEIGLSELVVKNEEEYIELAGRLAIDTVFRTDLQEKILNRMQDTPAFLDPKDYAQKIGTALKNIVNTESLIM